jgi:hypothetical protein
MAITKTCFIISPIGADGSETRKNSDLLYAIILTPVLHECGYEALRADMMPVAGMINPHIIRHIVEDDLAIADLTGMNPNVFYELAIRHVIGKPYIHLIREGESIPFDVKDIHTIAYSIEVEKIEKAKEKIRAQISYFEGGNPVISPFTMTMDILARQRPDQTAATLQTVMDQLDRLEASIQKPQPIDPDQYAPVVHELSERLQRVTQDIKRSLDGMKDRIAESVTMALAPAIEAVTTPKASPKLPVKTTDRNDPAPDYEELIRREVERETPHRQRGAPNTFTVSEYLERESVKWHKKK